MWGKYYQCVALPLIDHIPWKGQLWQTKLKIKSEKSSCTCLCIVFHFFGRSETIGIFYSSQYSVEKCLIKVAVILLISFPHIFFDVFLFSILITTGTGDLLSPWLIFFNSAHFCRLWQTKLWRNNESLTCASFFQECSVSTVLKYWMFDKNRYGSYLTHMHSFEINLFVFPVYLCFSSFPLGCLSYHFCTLLQPLFSFYLLVPGTS